VGKISEIEQLRRTNLARLRKEFGPAKLAEETGLSVAHLYQMSEGKGKNARNVNDEHAKLIESKAGKPDGWLDQPEHPNVQPIASARKKPMEWPFPFSYAEWVDLDDAMRTAVIATATTFVQSRKSARKRQQRGR
jgi:hypothetical protein